MRVSMDIELQDAPGTIFVLYARESFVRLIPIFVKNAEVLHVWITFLLVAYVVQRIAGITFIHVRFVVNFFVKNMRIHPLSAAG